MLPFNFLFSSQRSQTPDSGSGATQFLFGNNDRTLAPDSASSATSGILCLGTPPENDATSFLSRVEQTIATGSSGARSIVGSSASSSPNIADFVFKTPLPKKPISSISSKTSGNFTPTFLGNGSKMGSVASSSPKYDLFSCGSSSTGRGRARTPAPSSSSGASRSYVIVAVVEGRGLAKGEIGLASMDLRHPELCLAQFADTGSYAKLRVKFQILNPVEVIVPDTAIENGGNMLALLESLQRDFPKMQISPVQRKFFNEARGIETVNVLRTDDCATIEKDISNKYYCLSCASALIRYIEQIQNIVFASRSVKVTYKGTERSCLIDPATAKHLELLVNLRNVADTDSSLYGVLNHTFTTSGARMLRASILQPPADLDAINKRLDAVGELLNDLQDFQAIRSLIARMLDVDHLVSLCAHINKEDNARIAEHKITQIIYLKHTLELVEPLRECIGKYSNHLFRTYYDLLVDERFNEIIDKINIVIREETRYDRSALHMRSQKCFAVKPNINGLLDIARRTYSELVQDVEELCNDVAESTNLPLTVGYSPGREFYLQMKLKDDAPLNIDAEKSPLINIVRKGCTISCTTRNLVKLNDRIIETVNEIFNMSNIVVNDLLGEIRPLITCLYNLTEVVGSTDMLSSFAVVCTSSPGTYIRPQFSSTMAISQGRHPLLEKFCDECISPNDVYAGNDISVVIITGPNMAGKSTYLKMVAILQILAQIGCYVPADYASFRITTQIFSRIGQNDDLEHNYSALMVEMKDIAYILQNFTDSSLIIIDELGRSTSPEEGVGLCFAICEHLICSKAFVFLATHFLELTALDSIYANVENYHFENQIETFESVTHVEIQHTLKRGPYRGAVYGFEIAELSQIPRRVISLAKQMAESMRLERPIKGREQVDVRKEQAVIRLGLRLMRVTTCYEEMDEDQLREYLQQIRQRFFDDLNYAATFASSQSTDRSFGSIEGY